MMKRERLASSEDECKVSVDRISVLSNGLLEFILSLLTLKEATATSIVCRGWKYLWSLTPKLDLDGTESLWKVRKSEYKESVLDEERSNYVRWVDRVVALPQSSTLEEFRVFFDLTRSCSERIDEWLRYALSRKVQRLELNLTDIGSRRTREYDECYTFPYKKGNFPDNFKFIKKLSTHFVNMSGEAVEFFLGNCPLLEQVSVSGSGQLKALEIIRPFPSFKCLEISLCHNLNSVAIRDSNVVSIKYSGKRIRFLLMNVPLLTEIWIGGVVTDRMKHVVEMFSRVLPQLEMFKIYYLYKGLSWKETRKFLSAVQMCNLKQLVRFVLEAPHIHSEYNNFFESARATKKIAYPHLREVEFVGYRGVHSQFQLVKHFVENAVALENIVVDPRGFEFHLDRPWDRISRRTIDGELFARAYAKEQLKEYVPSRINVKML